MVGTRVRGLSAALVLILSLFVISGCHVRVFSSSPYGESVTADSTLLAVLSPAEDASFAPSEMVAIEWSGSVEAEFVSIDLYRYGQFLSVIAEAAPNTGHADWMIPADFPAMVEATGDYQISIRAQDGNHYPGELYVEALSERFTIVPGASGGLSDVTVTQRLITITVTDNGQEIDGDTVDIVLNGSVVASDHILAGPPGTDVALVLSEGLNFLEIIALNEGSISPNTAELFISNVTEGDSRQEWRLSTGESGTLTITAP